MIGITIGKICCIPPWIIKKTPLKLETLFFLILCCRWPLLVDTTNVLSTFIRHRDCNCLAAADPDHMQADRIRLGLLGSLRWAIVTKAQVGSYCDFVIICCLGIFWHIDYQLFISIIIYVLWSMFVDMVSHLYWTWWMWTCWNLPKLTSMECYLICGRASWTRKFWRKTSKFMNW